MKPKAATPHNLSATTTIHDAIRMDPKKTIPIFHRYKLYCPTCKGAMAENLGYISRNYGIDLEKFLTDLKKALA